MARFIASLSTGFGSLWSRFIFLPSLLLILLPDFHLYLSGPLAYSSLVAANRVIEMSDRLVDLYPTEKRSFLVKFYAPWCHHCKELEPTWSQVAQQIANVDSSIIVGRVDCTKYGSVAQHFGIRGFPSILFINAHKKVEFKSERTREEILDFAARVSGPPVHYLDSCEQLEKLLASGERRVAFINIGPEANENFTSLAATWQQFDWFYRSMVSCRGVQPGVYVFKAKNIVVQYDETKDGDMGEWVKKNRYAPFFKLTPGNLHMAFSSQKLLAIALVDEFRSSGRFVDAENLAFHRLAESIAFTYKNVDEKFLICYSSSIDTFNSITMHSIQPIPNFLVLNTSSIEYYLFNDGTKKISQQAIVQWLDDVVTLKLEPQGGDRYHHRMLRLFYDIIYSLSSMFQGNPILTMVIFGLPGAFFSMLIYVTCCSDWNGGDPEDEGEEELLDDEEDDDLHEKRE